MQLLEHVVLSFDQHDGRVAIAAYLLNKESIRPQVRENFWTVQKMCIQVPPVFTNLNSVVTVKFVLQHEGLSAPI